MNHSQWVVKMTLFSPQKNTKSEFRHSIFGPKDSHHVKSSGPPAIFMSRHRAAPFRCKAPKGVLAPESNAQFRNELPFAMDYPTVYEHLWPKMRGIHPFFSRCFRFSHFSQVLNETKPSSLRLKVQAMLR